MFLCTVKFFTPLAPIPFSFTVGLEDYTTFVTGRVMKEFSKTFFFIFIIGRDTKRGTIR